jgi:hypothetical protein
VAFRRPQRDLNFPDVESLEEAEFLAPAPRLLDDKDRHRHRQAQRRLAVAERNEELTRQWRAKFPSDVIDEEVFFNELTMTQRRIDRRRRRKIVEREIDNPNTTWGEDDASDAWTATTSNDE